MPFFVRFILAFVVTLAIAVAIIWFVVPMFSKVKSPATEKAAIMELYKEQNDGVQNREATAAFTGVSTTCLFFDTSGGILPVPPMQQKLTSLYAGMRHVKATTKLSAVNIDTSTANVTASVVAANKVDWLTKSGQKMEVRTTTHDTWDKVLGKWNCVEVKMTATNNTHASFVVPH
jgi:hypothetical protein